TAATLNYVSEVGFLCKPQTVDASAETTLPTNPYSADSNAKDIVDPATGLWYHDEIFDTIVANGFIPVTATDTSGSYGDLADGPPISENAAAGDTYTAYDLLSGTDLSSGGSTYLNTSSGVTVSGDTYPNTTISEQSDPIGYCILSDTNSNTNS
ncbi:MAG TPA: hypothetical protein VEG62_03000, partial [Acidimicrobiales bacterium]|nr:hypothetical protein [Acidimicrobiales bacterium]